MRTTRLAIAAAVAGLLAATSCTPAPGGGGGSNQPDPGCFEVDILQGTPVRHRVSGSQFWIHSDGDCTTAPNNGPFSVSYVPNFTSTQQEIQDYCDAINAPGTTTGYHAGAAWVPEQPGWVACMP